MNNRTEQMSNIQREALDLFIKKNSDYGDAFATYGPVGVLVRMGDKISRLQSVTGSGINLVDTESLRDTLIDLHNYSAMAIMLLDENKKLELTQRQYLQNELEVSAQYQAIYNDSVNFPSVPNSWGIETDKNGEQHI